LFTTYSQRDFAQQNQAFNSISEHPVAHISAALSTVLSFSDFTNRSEKRAA